MTRLTATNTDAALDKITHIMSELPLDHDKRDTFVRHLDRVGVSQLVGREPPSHTCGRGRVMQLLARG
jgi:hypothetical protein